MDVVRDRRIEVAFSTLLVLKLWDLSYSTIGRLTNSTGGIPTLDNKYCFRIEIVIQLTEQYSMETFKPVEVQASSHVAQSNSRRRRESIC